MTYDNGSVFSEYEYELTEKETRITIYFAYPYILGKEDVMRMLEDLTF